MSVGRPGGRENISPNLPERQTKTDRLRRRQIRHRSNKHNPFDQTTFMLREALMEMYQALRRACELSKDKPSSDCFRCCKLYSWIGRQLLPVLRWLTRVVASSFLLFPHRYSQRPANDS